MKDTLTKEAQGDEEAYDKMVCWCETNDKEKSEAIAGADAHMNDLFAEIEERAARDAELNAQIKQLFAGIMENEGGMDRATKLREKEYAAFTVSEKEMMQAATQLKNAIIILSKHHAGLLQLTPALQESLGSVLQWSAIKHEEMLAAKASRSGVSSGVSLLSRFSWTHKEQGRTEESKLMSILHKALKGASMKRLAVLPAEYAGQLLEKFARTGPSLMQQSNDLPSYTPASSEIVGILKQMKDEFEANLSQAQKEEMQAQQEFEQLKATKEEEIAAARKMRDDKKTEMYANKKALEDAKEDLDSTSATFRGDKKFLMDLRLTCQKLDKEWEERSKTRREELQAVTETIGILTEDDAREHLAKTVTLIQVQQSHRSSIQALIANRKRASAVLQKAAGELAHGSSNLLPYWGGQMRPDAQLSQMAVDVKLDAFTKVKAAMDKMISELKAQQSEEVKLKEFCTTELNENEKQTYSTNQHLTDTTAKIEGLDATIGTLEKEIESAKETIASLQMEIKKAGEVREKENADYQTTVGDQRATQEILKKATARMQKFYAKKSFLQEDPSAPPGGGFTKYKKNSGASGVIGLLEQITEESIAVEKEAIAGEAAAQKAYEGFVNDSNAAIDDNQNAILNKADNISSAKADRENAEMEKESAEHQLQSLGDYAADLHEQCDFVLKNFDIRQAARLKEIEAIQEAKAILSGMEE
jgi:chromosome segregation ATPase